MRVSRLFAGLSLTAIIAATSSISAFAAPFTVGNLLVYRVGNGGATTLTSNGNAVFIDEFTKTGTLVQSVQVSTTAGGQFNTLVAAGTASSEGFLNISPDGRFVTVTGYNATTGGGTALPGTNAATVNRAIAVYSTATGTKVSQTNLTDFASAGNPRSAVTTDGTSFYGVGSTGGVRYVPTVASTTSTQVAAAPTNVRVANVFDGRLFFDNNTTLSTFGPALPTTSGQTATSLVTGQSSIYGFFLADLNPLVGFDGTSLDTLYLADDSGGATGGIKKFSFVSGSWTANGSLPAAAVRGLTGFSLQGGSVQLWGTTGGTGASGGGSLYSLTDTSGYNTTISGSVTTIATAATNTAFRGIVLVVPEANALVLAGLALPMLAGTLMIRRRK